MLDARERPGRGINQDICLVFERERSIHLGKPKIVTNAQPKPESTGGNAREGAARSEALALIPGSDREKMRLSITGRYAAIRIDEDLRIKDDLTGPFRNA